MIYNWTARLESRLFEKERDWSRAVHLESRLFEKERDWSRAVLLESRLFEKERDWSRAVLLESRGPLLALCVCFHRIAGADEIAIAVDVVDAGHRRPELMIAKVGQGEGGLLA